MRSFRLSLRDKRIVAYCVGLATYVFLLTVGYWWGMAEFEARPRPFSHAFLVVVETLTTTGFGGDAPWTSSAMHWYISFVQVSGVLIGFVALRVLVIPLFESSELHVNDSYDPQKNHVIVCEYDRDVDSLLAEFDSLEQAYTVIVRDEATAREFYREGIPVVHGDSENVETLEKAGIYDATTVITDAGRMNAEVLLTLNSLDHSATVVCLSDDPQNTDAYEYVGADSVISPQHLLGHTLGVRATGAFDRELSTSAELAGDSVLLECDVQDGSQADGTTVLSNPITTGSEAEIVGIWKEGELEVPPEDSTNITSRTVLSILAPRDELDHVQNATTNPEHEKNALVLGLGNVGTASLDVLQRRNIPVKTLDADPSTGAEYIGKATDKSMLTEMGIDEAGAVVVTVSDDSDALLAIAIARTMNPSVDIFARLTDANTIERALQAGADYALSLPQISARIAARVLRDEEVVTLTQQSRVIRAPASEHGTTLEAVYTSLEDTEWSLLAIEHDERVILPSDIETLAPESTLLLVAPNK